MNTAYITLEIEYNNFNNLVNLLTNHCNTVNNRKNCTIGIECECPFGHMPKNAPDYMLWCRNIKPEDWLRKLTIKPFGVL